MFSFTLYLDPRNTINIMITPSLFLLIIIHCICTLTMNTIIITSFILPIESSLNIIIYYYFNRGEKNTSSTKPNQKPIHLTHHHCQYYYYCRWCYSFSSISSYHHQILLYTDITHLWNDVHVKVTAILSSHDCPTTATFTYPVLTNLSKEKFSTVMNAARSTFINSNNNEKNTLIPARMDTLK